MSGESEEVSGTPPYASLTVLVPDWEVSTRVTVLSTTRTGGVSQAPFESLNLGLHVNDRPDDVKENRRRVEDSFALPDSPCWLNQTHGITVAELSGNSHEHLPTDADGAWTDSEETVLGILTADCLPVVISDRARSQIAVVHAGWKGLANGILANALAVFPESADLHAWLGPAIGPSAFEVGEDVVEAFKKRDAVHISSFAPKSEPGKYLADLYALARAELTSTRTVKVTGGDYCTHTQSKLFHSYRRDGVGSGRMATIAWISKA